MAGSTAAPSSSSDREKWHGIVLFESKSRVQVCRPSGLSRSCLLGYTGATLEKTQTGERRMWHHLTPPRSLSGPLIHRHASPMRPDQGYVSVSCLTPFLVWVCCCQISTLHARILPSPALSILRRTSALNFVFGTRLLSPSRWPATSSLSSSFYFLFFFSLTGLFSHWYQKENLEIHLYFFSFHLGNKNKLKWKNSSVFFFYFIVFFSNSRHNVYQYSNPSVSTPRFSVRTSRHISYWTVFSYATPYSLHLSSVL